MDNLEEPEPKGTIWVTSAVAGERLFIAVGYTFVDGAPRL
jgi:hypothetical protein